jgi:hypothetical protein
MLVYRIVSQQATPTPRSAPHPAAAQSSELRETIRQITMEAQAAAQEAQVAARHAKAAAAAQATTVQGSHGQKITIDEHGIVVGPNMPNMPNMPSMPSMPNMPNAPVLAAAPPEVFTIAPSMDNMIPPQAVDLAYGFFIMCAVMVIGWPLARAFGRRIERRADTAVLDPVFAGQLQRIEQAVDAMSIEIERISESQRFMAKLQNGAAEHGALPSVERR